jgi:hypothetical protein
VRLSADRFVVAFRIILGVLATKLMYDGVTGLAIGGLHG